MRLGLTIANFDWPGGPQRMRTALDDIVTAVDQCGVHSVWFMDHFLQIPLYGPPDDPILDAYSVLAYAAARTSNVQLGTLVTGVTNRQPAVLVKMMTTLDILSGGRAILGIGAGGFTGEAIALGLPSPAIGERFDRLDETLRIAHQMWSGDRSPFIGKYYQLAEPINSPNVWRRPPVLIAGGGERRTLRLVAQHGDACNLFEPLGPDALRRKFEVLRAHCDTAGRSFTDISRTTYGELRVHSPAGKDGESVDQLTTRLARLAEIGVDEAILGLHNPLDPGVFEQLAEVATQLRPLVPAGRG